MIPGVRRMVAGASRGRLAGWVVLAGLLSGCVFSTGRPPADVVAARDGPGRAVVLVQLTTRIDGRELPAMPAMLPMDSIWLAWGGFDTGGRLEMARQRFFSNESRREGWTYLLLEPGIHYFSVNTPQGGGAIDYDRSWRHLPTAWRLDVPEGVPVIYAGTLYVPGDGSRMLFGGRRLQRFHVAEFEVRDESGEAAWIHSRWLSHLGPMRSVLMQPHDPSAGPVLIETPPGR